MRAAFFKGGVEKMNFVTNTLIKVGSLKQDLDT